MPTTDHPPCPLCAAIGRVVSLASFLHRTHPFVETACLCEERHHRVLLDHPHLHEGCAGYPWQRVTHVQEVPHGID